MTRNEAIELLQFYKKGLFDAASNQLSGDIQAFDMAIQALEQEPCEDTISRQAALDIVDSYSESPSNVEDVTQDIISDIVVLPSVKPQEPKTGHWILQPSNKEQDERDFIWWKCSECGQVIYSETEKDRREYHAFCGRCGAKMD